MFVNGERKSFEGEISVSELLTREGFDPGRVAVEVGGEIIPKKSYGNHMLRDGDKIEIVCFVGGG